MYQLEYEGSILRLDEFVVGLEHAGPWTFQGRRKKHFQDTLFLDHILDTLFSYHEKNQHLLRFVLLYTIWMWPDLHFVVDYDVVGLIILKYSNDRSFQMCRYNTQAMLSGHQSRYQGLSYIDSFCCMVTLFCAVSFALKALLELLRFLQAWIYITICVDVLQVGFLWCLPWWALGVKLFPGLECSCSGYKLGCVFKCCIFVFSFRACLSIVSSPSTNTDKTAYASSYCRSCTDHASWAWLTWPLTNLGGWFPSCGSTNFRRCYVEGTQTFAYSTHLRHYFPCCFG